VTGFRKDLPGLDDTQRARLQKIAPALSTLHENILPVREVGADFVVMERVDQPRTLADALGQPFAPARACHITLQILAALEAMPIVHGDVRPPNVFLDDADHVRVTDFGLQWVMTVLRETRVGPPPPARIGMYAPPERHHGTDALDHQADVYGVGAMLYEMLAGTPPFDPHLSVFVLSVDAQTIMPPPLTDQRLDAIVQCAMSKDPWLRFPTATEMAKALHAEREAVPNSVAGGPEPSQGSGQRSHAEREAVPNSAAGGPEPSQGSGQQ